MKNPVNEIDLLKSRVAKQRNEIGRLSHALERCAEEKRLLAIDVRAARRMGQLDSINLILEHLRNGATADQLKAALESTQTASLSS